MLRRLDEELTRQFQLTLGAAEVLYELRSARKPLRIKDLAHWALISPSTVSRSVDRLESRGLVRRETSQADRRESFVSITDEGVRIVRKMRSTEESIVNDLLADRLTAEQLEVLVDILRGLGWVNLELNAPPIADPDAYRHAGSNWSR